MPVVFDRLPKTTLYSELEEEATLKWQEEWESCNKACRNKTVLPKRSEQDPPQNKNKPELHGTGNWTW